MRNIEGEFRPIKGYEGNYEIDMFGNIYSLKWGKRKKLKQFCLNSRVWQVQLTKDGKGKKCTVSRLVYENFIGEIPKGARIGHINGDIADNFVNNLKAYSPEEWKKLCSKRMAETSRKPVVKKTHSGKVVEYYKSLTEAAAKNFVHVDTMWDKIHAVRSKSVLDDYIYQYDI